MVSKIFEQADLHFTHAFMQLTRIMVLCLYIDMMMDDLQDYFLSTFEEITTYTDQTNLLCVYVLGWL